MSPLRDNLVAHLTLIQRFQTILVQLKATKTIPIMPSCATNAGSKNTNIGKKCGENIMVVDCEDDE